MVQRSLENHMKTAHQDDAYTEVQTKSTFQKCSKCEHTTNSENGICWRHEELHEMEQKWRKCGYPDCITYTSKNFCSHHEEIHERESKWRKCSMCETFTTKGLCSDCKNSKSCTSTNPEKSAEIVDRIRNGECCELCEKNFVNSSMLYVHLWNSHDIRTFDGEYFEDEEDFLDHVKSISRNESVETINKSECLQPIIPDPPGGGWVSRQKFEKMAVQKPKSPPVMVHLGFANQKSPKYPVVLAKTGGPNLEIIPLNSIICEKCGDKNFKSDEALKEHSCKIEIFKVTSESDDTKTFFPCDICDKSFSTQDDLQKHESEHYAYVDTNKSGIKREGSKIVVNLGDNSRIYRTKFTQLKKK